MTAFPASRSGNMSRSPKSRPEPPWSISGRISFTRSEAPSGGLPAPRRAEPDPAQPELRKGPLSVPHFQKPRAGRGLLRHVHGRIPGDRPVRPFRLHGPQLDLFSMDHEKKYGALMNDLIRMFLPPQTADAKQQRKRSATWKNIPTTAPTSPLRWNRSWKGTTAW